MKTLKNIARFALMVITSAVTIFFFALLLCRTDLFSDLFDSKPVMLVLGLAIGATIGLLVGFITTYLRFEKELADKNNEVKKLQKDLNKAEEFVKQLLPTIRQAKRNQAKNYAEKSGERAQRVFSEIEDLSDEDNKSQPAEETAPDSEETEVEPQEDTSSDET